jgi:predicted metal-dependent phosphotriesterase family hydrolase
MTPLQITIDETTYEASRLTQELQDAFGRWCEDQAWRTLRHTRAKCNDAEYAVLLSEHQAMKRFDGFEIGARGSQADAYLATKDGYVHFVFLAMRKCQGVTEEQVKAMMAKHPQEFLDLFQTIMASKKN